MSSNDKLEHNKALVRAFFDGQMRPDRAERYEQLLDEDFRFWSVPGSPVSGTRDKAGMIAGFGDLFKKIERVDFFIDYVTAEDDRVVVQAHSHCPLNDGKVYANTYSFHFRIKGDRILETREYLSTEALKVLTD